MCNMSSKIFAMNSILKNSKIHVTFFTFIPFLIYVNGLYAQNSLKNLLDSPNNYSNYNLLKKDELLYLTSEFGDSYIQKMAMLASFFGKYDLSESIMNKRNMVFESNKLFDVNEFNAYSLYSALDILDSLSKINQIIILNEEHNNPKYRISTMNLLQIFYNNGYRYLAVESLNALDSNINDRKYPLMFKTGYYIDEPCYGEMIRVALKIGYKLISYESQNFDINMRQMNQAKNIYNKIFTQDENAKVLIHCGYSNGLDQKLEYSSFQLMGYHLHNISGINPLVINQIIGEKKDTQQERKDYAFSENKYNYKEPVIFKNANNKFWAHMSDGDIVMFLPKSSYKKGRPDWLFSQSKIEYFPNLKNIKTFPCLIRAFYELEGTESVPADQYEYEDYQDIPLILKKGNFIIQYLNTEGQVFEEYKISI